MTPTNFQLLSSQEAINALLDARIRGIYALRVRDIAEAAKERIQRVQEVRQQLQGQVEEGTVEEDSADAELQEVLEKEVEIDVDPIPQEALEGAEISGRHLIDLDWMIDREE